jgi:hypothetical protein
MSEYITFRKCQVGERERRCNIYIATIIVGDGRRLRKHVKTITDNELTRAYYGQVISNLIPWLDENQITYKLVYVPGRKSNWVRTRGSNKYGISSMLICLYSEEDATLTQLTFGGEKICFC